MDIAQNRTHGKAGLKHPHRLRTITCLDDVKAPRAQPLRNQHADHVFNHQHDGDRNPSSVGTFSDAAITKPAALPALPSLYSMRRQFGAEESMDRGFVGNLLARADDEPRANSTRRRALIRHGHQPRPVRVSIRPTTHAKETDYR